MSIGARELDSAVYVKVAPDGDTSAVRASLEKELAGFPTVTLQDQASLKDQINGQFDRVFIDTPPALNFYTRSALIAAQGCLIPFDCDDFSHRALYGLLDSGVRHDSAGPNRIA